MPTFQVLFSFYILFKMAIYNFSSKTIQCTPIATVTQTFRGSIIHPFYSFFYNPTYLILFWDKGRFRLPHFSSLLQNKYTTKVANCKRKERITRRFVFGRIKRKTRKHLCFRFYICFNMSRDFTLFSRPDSIICLVSSPKRVAVASSIFRRWTMDTSEVERYFSAKCALGLTSVPPPH